MAPGGRGEYDDGVFLPDPSGHRDVALGLCRSAGRVLLLLNARSSQGMAERFWDLPGGTVEEGESVRDALVREWREEVGWSPVLGDLLFVSDGRKRTAPDAPPLYTWRTFVLGVEAPAFGAMHTPGPEIDKIEFVRDDDALLRLSAPYHAPLRDFLAGRGARIATVDWIEPDARAASTPVPPPLRHLLILAAAAATGDAELVASQTRAARTDGVDVATLEETLLQIVPYAGFPRALAAFSAARPALGPAAGPASDGDPAARPTAGDAAFRSVYGDTADRVAKGLSTLHPLLPPWTKEFAYGRVLSRAQLDLVTRELLAVAILTALGRCDDALLGHMRAAVRLGASSDAVAGAIAVVPASVGPGRRAAARALLARV